MSSIKKLQQALRYVNDNRPLFCIKCNSEDVDVVAWMGSPGPAVYLGRCNKCGEHLTKDYLEPMSAAKAIVDSCR